MDCVVKQQYFTEFLAVFMMPFILVLVIFVLYVVTVRRRVRALRRLALGHTCPASGRMQRALGLDRRSVHESPGGCVSGAAAIAPEAVAATGGDHSETPRRAAREMTPRMRMLAVLGSISGHKARVWESLTVLRTSGTALHGMTLCPCIPRSSDVAPPPRYMLCKLGRAQLFVLEFRARVIRVVLMILLFLYAPVRATQRLQRLHSSCLVPVG